MDFQKMNLIFQETANRNQCECEIPLEGFTMQCTFSTSQTVTIPAGLQLSEGSLTPNETSPAATISICKNHENRLRKNFTEILNSKSFSSPE
jgi:hypothetical protein